jgi:hypothetical protein
MPAVSRNVKSILTGALFRPGEKEKKTQGIDHYDPIDDPLKSGERDEERRCHQGSDKRADEIEAVAAAVIRVEAEIEPVGNNK